MISFIMINISNKRGIFNYEFDWKISAGLVLKSEEVKSIRKSGTSLFGVYGVIKQGEVFLKSWTINGAKNRDKKLLLNKKEIKKLIGLYQQKSKVLIPIQLFETKKGLFKIEMGFGQLIKKHDKRKILKEKQIEMDMKRI